MQPSFSESGLITDNIVSLYSRELHLTMHFMPLKTTLATIFIVFSTPTFSGEIYRWVDDQQRVHFGDRPQHEAEIVPIKNTVNSADFGADHGDQRKTRSLLELYESRKKDKLQNTQEREKKTAISNRLNAKCKKYKSRLALYDGYRHRRTDNSGKVYYLSDREIAAEKSKVIQLIKKHCN